MFKYGIYRYEYLLIRQTRRSIALTVEPCMDIVLKVPNDLDEDSIHDFLVRKWRWLREQLAFFEKYKRTAKKKNYASGESFYYLGRQYQLIVKKAEKSHTALTKGRLLLSTTYSVDNYQYNRMLLTAWYRERARIVFMQRYERMLPRFSYKHEPLLVIKSMPKRWGSYIKGEKIILNPLLIHASKESIDYVIAHELCHMRYKNHDRKFYNLLSTHIPDWKLRKEKLELLAQ